MSPLIYLSCAWLSGVFAGSLLKLPVLLVLSGLAPLPFLLMRRYRPAVILASLCLITFFTAAAYSSSTLSVTERNLAFHNGATLKIRGAVNRDPEVTDKSAQLYFAAREINIDGAWQPIEGAALLFAPRYADYRYGDILTVKGRLETPPQLGDFDYAGYLANQGIGSVIYRPDIHIEARHTGSPLLAHVYDFRASLAGVLAEALPEPQASLAQGIILGIRANIPLDVKHDFTRSGAAHILAISGVNLSIIAGIMLSVGVWLFGRRHYYYVWLALATVWLYALLTGLHPPVLRGAIMASLFLGAELFGRQKTAFVPLTLAAAIMVGLSPRLLKDASFQLSFVAMAGLVFLYPVLRDLGRKAIDKAFDAQSDAPSFLHLISDSLAATFAATIFVWPLIARYFGIVSLASPIATLLALPALPATIILGTLTGVVGLFFTPAAMVVGIVTWLFLSYILLVAHAFTLVPVVAVRSGTLGSTTVLVYYALLAVVLWLGSRHSATVSVLKSVRQTFDRIPRQQVIAPLAVVAIVVWTAAITMPDDKVHVSFLDVGQGDAILISRGSRQILVDGGPSPQSVTRALGQQMPFWDRSLDLLVLTHPDADHLTGLVEVSQRYHIGQAVRSATSHSGPLYDTWQKALSAHGVTATPLSPGQAVRLGNILATVLHPASDLAAAKTSNDRSLVLRVESGAVSFLLTSDIGLEAESALLQERARVASAVLKVAHHGSTGASSAPFLAAVNPQVAVISVGAGNAFGHPSINTMARLGETSAIGHLYRTDVNGTVEFITDGERLWVKTDR